MIFFDLTYLVGNIAELEILSGFAQNDVGLIFK